jgi:hypothetical protein
MSQPLSETSLTAAILRVQGASNWWKNSGQAARTEETVSSKQGFQNLDSRKASFLPQSGDNRYSDVLALPDEKSD